MKEELIKKLVEEMTVFCREAAIPADAAPMKAYLRDQFECLGLKSPLRKETLKAFWENKSLPDLDQLPSLVRALWASPYRELHYHAVDLLEKALKRAEGNYLPLLLELVQSNSWWDTVDTLAVKLIGGHLKRHPELERSSPEEWIDSENMWLRRTAILYQLKYKQSTDFERLKQYILATASEEEFFIRKAAGWALREYSKTDAKAVCEFVEQEQDLLSNLTKREALKWLNRK